MKLHKGTPVRQQISHQKFNRWREWKDTILARKNCQLRMLYPTKMYTKVNQDLLEEEKWSCHHPMSLINAAYRCAIPRHPGWWSTPLKDSYSRKLTCKPKRICKQATRIFTGKWQEQTITYQSLESKWPEFRYKHTDDLYKLKDKIHLHTVYRKHSQQRHTGWKWKDTKGKLCKLT